MQDEAQTNVSAEGRLLGFVRVLVGKQVFHLPVQAVSVENDGDRVACGFFDHEGQLGILVNEAAPASQLHAQIERGAAEAIRHLSRRVLN